VTPRILLGGTYRHRPSGRLVDVLDFEFQDRPRQRHVSARTGRFIVRPTALSTAPPFLAEPHELLVVPLNGH
jgi:hypothetical protein